MYKKIAKDLNNNQKRYTLYIIGTVSLLCLLLYLLKDSPSDVNKNPNRWRVNTITAQKTSATPELELYGNIINPFTSRLKSTIETYVDKVYIREGLYVKKDDVLVELDRSEIGLDVLQKKAIVDEMNAKVKLEQQKYEYDKKTLDSEKKELKLIEEKLERQKALRSKKLNSQLNLDEAAIDLQRATKQFYQRELEMESYEHRIAELKAQLAQAESEYGKARLDLDRTSVKAPFNGYISKLFVSPGTRIQPNETILEIFNQDTIEVRVQVPQTFMTIVRDNIKSADEIKASTEIFNKNYELKFRNLTANQDVSTAGTDAFFIFKDEESKKEIRTIGKTVTVILKLPELNDIFLVPSTSVYYNDRIYIIEENKLKSIDIVIKGSITKDKQDYIIITTNDLKEGDKVLASILPSAIDGLAVEVIE